MLSPDLKKISLPQTAYPSLFLCTELQQKHLLPVEILRLTPGGSGASTNSSAGLYHHMGQCRWRNLCENKAACEKSHSSFTRVEYSIQSADDQKDPTEQRQ